MIFKCYTYILFIHENVVVSFFRSNRPYMTAASVGFTSSRSLLHSDPFVASSYSSIAISRRCLSVHNIRSVTRIRYIRLPLIMSHLDTSVSASSFFFFFSNM